MSANLALAAFTSAKSSLSSPCTPPGSGPRCPLFVHVRAERALALSTLTADAEGRIANHLAPEGFSEAWVALYDEATGRVCMQRTTEDQHKVPSSPCSRLAHLVHRSAFSIQCSAHGVLCQRG